MRVSEVSWKRLLRLVYHGSREHPLTVTLSEATSDIQAESHPKQKVFYGFFLPRSAHAKPLPPFMLDVQPHLFSLQQSLLSGALELDNILDHNNKPVITLV